MIFNMVGGGGGGLKATDAVLIVTVPTGSTVTATKGGVTLTPTIWVQNADNTLDTAIFSIKASTFDANAWTVTATLGTDSASNTVVINEAKEYELLLSYYTRLFDNGDECVAVTGGWRSEGLKYSGGDGGTALTVTSITNGVKLTQSGGGRGGIYRTINTIDLAGKDSLVFTGKIYRDTTYHNNIGIYVVTAIGTQIGSNSVGSLLAPQGTKTYSDETVIDISSVNQSCYIYFFINSTDGKYIEVNELYLA